MAAALAALLGASQAQAQTQTEAQRGERMSLLTRERSPHGGRLDEALSLARQAEQIGATAGTRLFPAH